MPMIGHQHVSMHKEVSSITVMEDSLLNYGRNLCILKQRPALPRVGRNEVSGSALRAMFRSSHLASGAKALPPWAGFGGVKTPPFQTVSHVRRASRIMAMKSSNK